jgi:zinc transport system substrate-binding protein
MLWKSMKYQRVALTSTLLLLVATACADKPAPGGKPTVVVSVAPQAHFVERIAGGAVEVEVMIPPGASPTTYEPTIEQMTALGRASLYVKVGHPHFPFERAWLDKLLEGAPGIAVLDASAGVEVDDEDPHLWLSPRIAKRFSAAVAGKLVSLLPDERAAFERNLTRLRAEIDALDEEIRGRLDGLEGRRFFVFHPAWGYFAREYGLVQLSVEHGHKETNPANLKEVIEHARSEGVKTVFVQPQISRASAELIAAEIGGKVVALDPLAADWPGELRRAAAAFEEALRR